MHHLSGRTSRVTTLCKPLAAGDQSGRVQRMKIPGLIDLQVNGYKGVDFSGAHLTENDAVQACHGMLRAGTTAFLITVITSPTEVYRRNLPILARVIAREEFQGRLLGIHLEGPFLNPEEGARGAHNASWMRTPEAGYLDQLIAWAEGNVKLLTLAADLDGAADLARYATQTGVAVSLGHQRANEHDLRRLVEAGATALTHLGNGMPAMVPRHDNAIWVGLANDDLYATIIADGHHLPPALLKTMIRAKGVNRCILISDASSLSGLPPGRYQCMGTEVVLNAMGRLYDPATGYMTGSSATLSECVNFLASLNLVTPEELAVMVFDNPLKLIGISPETVSGHNDSVHINTLPWE